MQSLSPTHTSVMELRPMAKEQPRLHCCGTMIINIVIYVLEKQTPPPVEAFGREASRSKQRKISLWLQVKGTVIIK